MRYQFVASLVVIISVFFLNQDANAQQASSKKKPVPQKAAKELVLKALHVEAHIEKPSVSIVPKRIEPKLKEVEFIRRSFSKEIKNVPRELLYMEIKQSKSKQVAEARQMLRKERK